LLKEQNLAGAQRLRQNKRLLGAALIGLILLGALLYMVYWNRQVKIRNIKKLQDLNVQLEDGKEEISRINTLLEQKALHARMNPHFIFNCMSSVQECILTGQLDEANSYLTMLSRLLRMVLNHSDEEIVLLETELEMLNLYLQLERVRLKGNFDYSIAMEDDMMTEELKVPTLILQPFAENAIWHGLLNKTGNRMLRISGALTQDAIRLTVEDNGIGRRKAASLRHIKHSYKSVAIDLISKRLKILREQSGFEPTGFRIFDIFNHRQEPGGTKVEIILPLIN
jgi:LytS/YehU family sensor histidine kinase